MKDSLTFQLNSFSGPLEFLIALVQNQELQVENIPLQSIMSQFQDSKPAIGFDKAAEFVGAASFLIWYKSKQLLPQHEHLPSEEEPDPRFEIIHHLIDYCRFKDAAKALAEREQRQNAFYIRGTDKAAATKKPLGIEHLTLDDFALLFRQVIVKAASNTGVIFEEEWKVSDKISSLRSLLKQEQEVAFADLFTSRLLREELIVIFLAVLEMMKNGEIAIIKELETGRILIADKGKYGS